MTFSRARLPAALICGALVTLSVAAAAPAHAQRTAQDIETARQLFQQGFDLREKGDVKGALEKFRAAHALGNTPLTGIELCRTYAALKQPVEAREVCLGVGRIPPTAQETQRSQDARTEAGKIAEAEKPKISAVRVKLVGLPPGKEALVLVDGAAIPLAAVGEARAVNPGAHVVTTKVGDGPETKTPFETKEGESKDVDAAVAVPPDATPPPKPAEGATAPPPGSSGSHGTIATISFVVAGAAALVGVIGGVKASSDESDLERECVAKKCGVEYHDALSSAKTWGNVSTAMFVISGVALAGGVVALLTSPKSSSKSTGAARDPRRVPETSSFRSFTPVLGLGGAGVRGTF